MFGEHRFKRPARRAAAFLALAALVAGCASADKNASTTAASGSTTSASSSSMPGMSMGSGATSAGKPISVDGIKPVPTQVLASATGRG